jgi:capsular exopolysaccharide synthesis family protein
MSRIHEALKKAAEERSTQLAAGLVAGVGETAEETRHSVTGTSEVGLPVIPTRLVPGGHQAMPLRYEELVMRCAHPEWRLDPLKSVFQDSNVRHDVSERFRTLRSRLYQIAGTRTLRRLLVTSSVAGEGKSFVASNVAQSIVQQPDLRVLLLDADMRASRLHATLGAPNRPGLSDYLRGEASEIEIIQKGMEKKLFFIPGGSQVSNPSELLLSEKMKQLLDRFTPLFDWIVIDSPPAMPVHDASILADLTDGVLLVVQAGSTNVEIAEKTAAEFQGKNLLGVVLNRIEKQDSYGEYYYGYQDDKA